MGALVALVAQVQGLTLETASQALALVLALALGLALVASGWHHNRPTWTHLREDNSNPTAPRTQPNLHT